ncbi:MAG: PKD domain-containing protein, partial [Chitinophagaceae bacterium]
MVTRSRSLTRSGDGLQDAQVSRIFISCRCPVIINQLAAFQMKLNFTPVTGLFFALLVTFASCSTHKAEPRVLVFTKTTGFHHTSIPAGVAAVMKLGMENGFTVDTTSSSSYFQQDSLEHYAAVIFLNTTGDLLNNTEETDFERYIQAGGAFVGVHSATDGEYDWDWYGKLVGGYFESHPEIQEAVIQVVDSVHTSTAGLPQNWKRKDEWYNFKKLDTSVTVLLNLDETSYQGGKNGSRHPISWYHEYDGGRAWYTGLGHTDESYKDPLFLRHLLGGIRYAIGDNKKPDFKKAHTNRLLPDKDRFTKVQLTQGTLEEPTEMTILPNLDILIAQRRGEIMLYKQQSKKLVSAAKLDVYWKATTPKTRTEEGLLGIQADPEFATNHFVYVYYSPTGISVDRLSRFVFENDKINLNSEKVMLDVKTDREICCHTGGSIAFGPNRMVFLSTGDNSTPFDRPDEGINIHAFAPLDDRPGYVKWDSRRTAGNSNDLRGKIIRLQIKLDGTVEIPDGNLFPKGTEKARPEIYVMGNRNPYRISVDPKTSFVYWGEVGPDALNDSFPTRGPRGYDEINQARKAGNFGWPYFIGNNYPYREYDFGTGKPGELFQPDKPLNNSRNNTGLRELPPAQPAFIWYSYGESKEFPQVGSGGRTSMAGPIYYTDLYPEKTRLPDYYNGKFFIYEWMRRWIKVVSFDRNGNFEKMEGFMNDTKWNSPVDMEVGPDGKLYVLEYGTGWFTGNNDAGLARIDYNTGNRAPVVETVTADKTSGSLPFKLALHLKATDPEKDQLSYTWHIGDMEKTTSSPDLEYTLDKAGDYNVYVNVTDGKGNDIKSDLTHVYAGNEAPVVSIRINGNSSFYFPGKKVNYQVMVSDKEQTSAQSDLKNIYVGADYIEGSDLAGAMGHQVMSEAMVGESIVMNSDCKGCHKPTEKSIGPSFTMVANKYSKDKNSAKYLMDKIINGSRGVWGETAMPGHPAMKPEEVKAAVAWITSLAEKTPAPSLPPAGNLDPSLGQPVREQGQLRLTASYTDQGGQGVKPLTGTSAIILRNNVVSAAQFNGMDKFVLNTAGSKSVATVPMNGGWCRIDDVDLSGLSKVSIVLEWLMQPTADCDYELRMDSPTGT